MARSGPRTIYLGVADQQRGCGPRRLAAGRIKDLPKNVKKLQLLWKVKVPTKTMGMLSFREPLIVNGVKTPEGPGRWPFWRAANDVYAIDPKREMLRGRRS